MKTPVENPFGDPGALLLEDEIPPEPDWAYLDSPRPSAPVESVPVLASPVESVGYAIDSALEAQHAGNRAMATQLAALAAVLNTSRAHLSVYLQPGGLAEPDAVELAARAAALDAALQLNLTPNQVRDRAYEGQLLQEKLPAFWELFRLGLTSYAHAQAAVQFANGLDEPDAVAEYDSTLAAAAPTLTPAAFRTKARVLQQRLLAEPPAARTARALTERRVWVEPAEDGMAWLHALISAPDAIRVKARLNSTARNVQKQEKQADRIAREAGTNRASRRTRPQIRADLAVAWLAGDGTPTAAKVRPILLVPILSMLGTVGQDGQLPVLHGYGPIDPATAAGLFDDAPAFRRIGTDPISGEILDLDRTAYRPTKAQRDWLTVKYGRCARPGCDCDAATADIDHLREWARDHGPTNIRNLIPLCPPEHRLKTLTKIRISRDRDDGDALTIHTPTGYTARYTPTAYPDDSAF
ncbi:hypothetical protein GY24_01890 [Microterricola pindariensis]|uniref:HNH nuclease domain-containing protein n=2 Tax=Microterricola pindariensis TaxID=478010 RepID=A0ABX5B0U1_9MICO|nr:hypothetical protein GY24_01890 [Microterricola pindariensis]